MIVLYEAYCDDCDSNNTVPIPDCTAIMHDVIISSSEVFITSYYLDRTENCFVCDKEMFIYHYWDGTVCIEEELECENG